jgi:hypothetical protein
MTAYWMRPEAPPEQVFFGAHESGPRCANSRPHGTERVISMQGEPIPEGFCQCGCGRRTSVAKQSRSCQGHIKGEPHRFCRGHGHRKAERYRVEDRGYETPCWIWLLRINPSGYGTTTVNRGGRFRTMPAHRFFYEEHVGPIPEGLEIDHLCRVRSCVNPDHLEAVTQQENIRRSDIFKLTPEAVREIRESPLSHRKLARIYGVSRAQIWQIKSGRQWRDL